MAVSAEFGAIDTETIRGRAVVVAWSTGDESGGGARECASFGDCIDVIFGVGLAELWAYNLDYDARAILAWIPDREVVRAVYLRRPVEYRGVGIDYMPGRCLLLRRGRRVVRVWDAWQFWECSLDAAAAKLGIAGKSPISKRTIANLGRLRRGGRVWRRVVAYCRRDAYLCWRAAAYLRASFAAAGVDARGRYYSAGYLAKRYLAAAGVRVGVRPLVVDGIISAAYHGGRVELFARGSAPEAWSADIVSAYPAALCDCPDSASGRWIVATRPIPGAADWCGYLRVWTRPGDIQPFALSSADGNVYPELRGAVIAVYREEFETALRLGLVTRYEFLRVASLVTSPARPYAGLVRALFERKRCDGPDRLATKKILNSLYGVHAETVREYGRDADDELLPREYRRLRVERYAEVLGVDYHNPRCRCGRCRLVRQFRAACPGRGLPGGVSITPAGAVRVRHRPGRFTDLYVAGRVTAATRARLLEAMIATGRVLACNTDGFLSLNRPRVREGKDLGDWEVRRITDLTLLGNGIYEYRDETGVTRRLRGIESRVDLRAALSRARPGARVLHFTVERPLGIAESLLDETVGLNEFRRRRITLDLTSTDDRRQFDGTATAAVLRAGLQWSRPLMLTGGRDRR